MKGTKYREGGKRLIRLKNGQMIFYNFIRPHTTLGNKTPAQVAGINSIDDKQRWTSLLRNAMKDDKF